MSASSEVKIIYGGGLFGRVIKDEGVIKATLNALEAGGVKNIDSAQSYTGSEAALGNANAPKKFTIDTKHRGGLSTDPNVGTREEVFLSGKESLKALGTDKVDVFYIHAPKEDVPISSTLAGIQDLYLAGGFSRFGLSNYLADDVRKVYEHCKAQGYVLPTVYQGNYSAIARKQETVLFPTLRELGIAFYAYSPIAGGFLTKTKAQLLEGVGRFAPPSQGGLGGGIYHTMFVKPSYFQALEEWEQIAVDAGCSKAELAYRWIRFHSALSGESGDGVVFGASSVPQVQQTIKALEGGPLDANAVERINALWSLVEHDALLDCFQTIKDFRKA